MRDGHLFPLLLNLGWPLAALNRGEWDDDAMSGLGLARKRRAAWSVEKSHRPTGETTWKSFENLWKGKGPS